ncbi:MAG: aminoacyl-tRNA hydrolase [Desulfobacteraceae bacterium]|jgi:peptidyl-tRNA hydrolase, PTH1 family
MVRQNLYLVAGLGNPGAEYADTRHNAGFMVIDTLAAAHRIAVDRRKFNVVYGRGRIGGVEVLLAKPQAYMNRSGPPLRQLADYFRIQREAMIVIHDDIDLAFERLKIKEKGGDGGHKGIKSLIEAFGGDQFVRLRVGVGRSGHGGDVVGHVLSRFGPEEHSSLDMILRRAAEAIVTILSKGTKEGMNRYNQSPR